MSAKYKRKRNKGLFGANLIKQNKFLQKYAGLLFILPWIIGFIALKLYPLIASFWYSFTDADLFNTPKFVGLDNYIKLLTVDPEFKYSVKATLIYVIVGVPTKIVFALIMAMLLNSKIKFINLFRTIYYIPSILAGSVAISILWRFFFMENGIINRLISFIGVEPIPWLSSPDYAIFTISLMMVWQLGSSMVIFLAGLKQIPNELYEAAAIDGASKIKAFFKVTVPMITPMILFNLIMQMINAFQQFTAAFVVTNGGPVKSTYLVAMKLYNDAFSLFKMGYSSALSWMLFVVILLVTSLLFATSNKWVFYRDGGNL